MIRPVVVLLGFPLFCRHFGCCGALEPEPAFVLFDPQNGPLYTPKPLRLKGKLSNFDAKSALKFRKKSQKDK